MTEKNKKIIYLVYGIVQSLLLLVCGIVLICSALHIYDGGEGTYSRETVTAALKSIAIPLILCAVCIVAGGILTLVLPRDAKKPRGEMHPAAAIKRMSARVDTESCPEAVKALIKKEHTLRLISVVVAAVVCVAVAVPCCIYLFDLSHFDDIGEGLTEDIVSAMKYVLPASALGLFAVGTSTFLCHASYKRELAATKEAVKSSPKKDKTAAPQKTDSSAPLALWLVRGGVLLVAVVFILLGIFNDGMNDVLQKAIRICTECIGLG
ncbi:MAG: hypothetical protein IJW90_03240 [Clostridia bacterium]|nr:hypothetical protein [Clostridia bacterium]